MRLRKSYYTVFSSFSPNYSQTDILLWKMEVLQDVCWRFPCCRWQKRDSLEEYGLRGNEKGENEGEKRRASTRRSSNIYKYNPMNPTTIHGKKTVPCPKSHTIVFHLLSSLSRRDLTYLVSLKSAGLAKKRLLDIVRCLEPQGPRAPHSDGSFLFLFWEERRELKSCH